MVLAARAAAGVGPDPTVPRFVALDVGQGDSAVLRFPGGQDFLVDTGGSPISRYDIGRVVVAPALRGLGIRRLTAMMISHGHADHVGGAAGVLREVPTGEIWVGSIDAGDPAFEPLLSTAREAGIPVLSVAEGFSRASGDCWWTVLHPAGRWLHHGGAPTENDVSIVATARCGPRSVLFTGDAGSAVERSLRGRASAAGGLIKVPHHGSTTSSTHGFVAGVGARHAVISVGDGNRFGLPRGEILDRYRSLGIAVYRTDRDGAVTVELGRRIFARGERWTSGHGTGVRDVG